MIIPVRCFTCGKVRTIPTTEVFLLLSFSTSGRLLQLEHKFASVFRVRAVYAVIVLQVIGNKYESYALMLQTEGGKSSEAAAMDKLGLKRYCCRRMVLTHVDLIDKLLAYHTFQRKDESAAARKA
jgi:DNA-directed RNA polymerase I, II, and III subunit RPABC5